MAAKKMPAKKVPAPPSPREKKKAMPAKSGSPGAGTSKMNQSALVSELQKKYGPMSGPRKGQSRSAFITEFQDTVAESNMSNRSGVDAAAAKVAGMRWDMSQKKPKPKKR